MILVCDYCTKTYTKYETPRFKNHYCSRECAAKARDTRQKKSCAFCNKEIYVRKKNLKEHNFCSHNCLNNWQKRNKLEFTCIICNKKFYKSKSWLKQRKGYYCSLACRNKDKVWAENSYIKANQIQCHKSRIK